MLPSSLSVMNMSVTLEFVIYISLSVSKSTAFPLSSTESERSLVPFRILVPAMVSSTSWKFTIEAAALTGFREISSMFMNSA